MRAIVALLLCLLQHAKSLCVPGCAGGKSDSIAVGRRLGQFDAEKASNRMYPLAPCKISPNWAFHLRVNR